MSLLQVPLPVLPESLANLKIIDDDNILNESSNRSIVISTGNSWLLQRKNKITKEHADEHADEPVKEQLIISFSAVDIDADNSICIPLVEKKELSGCEIDDETLISISRKLNGLDNKYRIYLNDTSGWYSNIIHNISRLLEKKQVNLDNPGSYYAKEVVDRMY